MLTSLSSWVIGGGFCGPSFSPSPRLPKTTNFPVPPPLAAYAPTFVPSTLGSHALTTPSRNLSVNCDNNLHPASRGGLSPPQGFTRSFSSPSFRKVDIPNPSAPSFVTAAYRARSGGRSPRSEPSEQVATPVLQKVRHECQALVVARELLNESAQKIESVKNTIRYLEGTPTLAEEEKSSHAINREVMKKREQELTQCRLNLESRLDRLTKEINDVHEEGDYHTVGELKDQLQDARNDRTRLATENRKLKTQHIGEKDLVESRAQEARDFQDQVRRREVQSLERQVAGLRVQVAKLQEDRERLLDQWNGSTYGRGEMQRRVENAEFQQKELSASVAELKSKNIALNVELTQAHAQCAWHKSRMKHYEGELVDLTRDYQNMRLRQEPTSTAVQGRCPRTASPRPDPAISSPRAASTEPSPRVTFSSLSGPRLDLGLPVSSTPISAPSVKEWAFDRFRSSSPSSTWDSWRQPRDSSLAYTCDSLPNTLSPASPLRGLGSGSKGRLRLDGCFLVTDNSPDSFGSEVTQRFSAKPFGCSPLSLGSPVGFGSSVSSPTFDFGSPSTWTPGSGPTSKIMKGSLCDVQLWRRDKLF